MGLLSSASRRLGAARSLLGRPRRLARADAGLTQVLITGSGGLIGGILRAGLAERHAVYGLDRRRGDNVDRVVSMRRLERVAPLFEGIDVVIDLAADPRMSASWRSVLRNNVASTVNAFEAARRHGVSRIVFASSNHVTGLYEQDEPYASIVAGRYDGLDPASIPQLSSNSPVRPDSPYGTVKAFGEALGRFYADEHGISVICLRIGTVNGGNRPRGPREFATLLTHADLVRLVACCIDAPPDLGFAVLYGVSANTWRFWDLAEAREAVGYVPEDDAESFRPRGG